MNTPDQLPDYDSPWKDILEVFFREFITFYFPQVADEIAWERGYEFLESELRQIAHDAEVGRRYVDKLVRVWQRDGVEEWVLVHVEVQTGRDREFAERMYVYNNRIYDKYRRRVASFALLADDSEGWRPDRFEYNLWGSQVLLKFPTAKLLDWYQQLTNLEVSGNIFSAVTVAHLRMLETRNDWPGRLRWKIAVTQDLYDLGYQQSEIKYLFRFIDWLMMLPEDFNHQYYKAMQSYEENIRRPFVSIFEREGMKRGMEQGIEKGMEQGLQQALLEIVEEAHGLLPLELQNQITAIASADRLKELIRAVVKAGSLDQVVQLLSSEANDDKEGRGEE